MNAPTQTGEERGKRLSPGSGGTTSLCGRVRGQVMKVAAARVLDEASALADSHLPAS